MLIVNLLRGRESVVGLKDVVIVKIKRKQKRPNQLVCKTDNQGSAPTWHAKFNTLTGKKTKEKTEKKGLEQREVT